MNIVPSLLLLHHCHHHSHCPLGRFHSRHHHRHHYHHHHHLLHLQIRSRWGFLLASPSYSLKLFVLFEHLQRLPQVSLLVVGVFAPPLAETRPLTQLQCRHPRHHCLSHNFVWLFVPLTSLPIPVTVLSQRYRPLRRHCLRHASVLCRHSLDSMAHAKERARAPFVPFVLAH